MVEKTTEQVKISSKEALLSMRKVVDFIENNENLSLEDLIILHRKERKICAHKRCTKLEHLEFFQQLLETLRCFPKNNFIVLLAEFLFVQTQRTASNNYSPKKALPQCSTIFEGILYNKGILPLGNYQSRSKVATSRKERNPKEIAENIVRVESCTGS